MGLFGNKQPDEMTQVEQNINQVERDIQNKIFEMGQHFFNENRDNANLDEYYVKTIDFIKKLEQNRKGFYANKLRLQVPFVSENIFKYSFEDYNITGFLASEVGEDDIQEVNQTVNGVFALSKKAPTFNKKMRKLVLKHYNKLKFKKTDSKSMTIDGKSRKCKGYMVEITDDDARDFILDVQETYNEYYKETVGSNAYFKEYNLDEEFQELIQMCNKIGNVNTLDVCIYLYQGKLAAISSKDMALSLYFQGGGKRMTNMELRYEGLYDNFTIKKNGSMNGKKEIGKIICSEGKSSTQIATYGYNYKSGEFDLSVTSLLTMSGALDMKRNSIQLTIDNLNVENYNVGNGNVTLKKGENVKYLRCDLEGKQYFYEPEDPASEYILYETEGLRNTEGCFEWLVSDFDGVGIDMNVSYYDGTNFVNAAQKSIGGSDFYEEGKKSVDFRNQLLALGLTKTANMILNYDQFAFIAADKGMVPWVKITAENNTYRNFNGDVEPVVTCHIIKSGALQTEYLLPNSSEAYLTLADIQGFTKEELRVARNEIYARYGWGFDDENLANYFSQKSWYLSCGYSKNVVDTDLTEVEIANRDLIIERENELP